MIYMGGCNDPSEAARRSRVRANNVSALLRLLGGNVDWKCAYEAAYKAANKKPCVVFHAGGGWYAIATNRTHDTITPSMKLAHCGSRYRRKQIEQMTEELIGRLAS